MDDIGLSKSHTQWRAWINTASIEDLLRLQRFAAAGHRVFTDAVLTADFQARVKALGGFTPEVSKAVGW